MVFLISGSEQRNSDLVFFVDNNRYSLYVLCSKVGTVGKPLVSGGPKVGFLTKIGSEWSSIRDRPVRVGTGITTPVSDKQGKRERIKK